MLIIYRSKAIILLSYAGLCTGQNVNRMEFSYDSSHPYGPDHWGDVDVSEGSNDWFPFGERLKVDIDFTDNMCDNEDWPSPINLVSTAECEDSHEILTPRIRDVNCALEDLTFSIEPHTLRAYIPDGDSEECMRTWIDLPNGFPNKFYIWFIEIRLRGEHIFDGRRFDGEIIFVHGEYPHDKTALAFVSLPLDASSVRDEPKLQLFIDEWQTLHDSINTVCASRHSLSNMDRRHKPPQSRAKSRQFYDQVKTLKEYDPEWDYVEEQKLKQHQRRKLQDENVELVNKPKPFPYDLWPTIWYYRYRGSMTTPPCYNNVEWRIFDEPLKISRKQFKQLASLISSYKNDDCEPASAVSARGDTFRPLQDRNKDIQVSVTHCTIEDFEGMLYEPEDLEWTPDD